MKEKQNKIISYAELLWKKADIVNRQFSKKMQ